MVISIFSRPMQRQGLLFKHLFHLLLDKLINSLSHPLVRIFLRCRHAQMIKNCASSHKTNYIDIILEILNLEEHFKLLYWFKSYGACAKWVDFSYWWSCIGKGLTFSQRSRLVSLKKKNVFRSNVSF